MKIVFRPAFSFMLCRSDAFYFELARGHLVVERTDDPRYWFAQEEISEHTAGSLPYHGEPIVSKITPSKLILTVRASSPLVTPPGTVQS